MWLLESADAFDGRRMWLRPGKTYLFGRTASEPGQLAISHSTISRKHLTITVDNVQDGHTNRPTERSKLTVEDLATKIGTVVNGKKIRGGKYVSNGEELQVTMGKCPSKFSIIWFPVVFTFSFTNKELHADPMTNLRRQFEQLDVKLLTEYEITQTTHVVSRKRNTAKGLQALINGKYIVSDTFLDAITQAGEVSAESELSALEQDFDQCWPDALSHLPPRGAEPVQHPDSIYVPDAGRNDVFDGYTFIFYDKTQYSNLMAPITNGGGKALMQTIEPRTTQVDDFVRYVKEVAGEEGLGSFEDGSEGRGVVLVRYLPAKGGHIGWYAEFITEVSLRLDHRPIEQNEFLEAILIKDASILRRPLEVDTTAGSQELGQVEAPPTDEVDCGEPQSATTEVPLVRPRRTRRPVKRRFAGFDDDADIDMDEPLQVTTRPDSAPNRAQNDDGGLFVSQEQDVPVSQFDADGYEASSRKRRASFEDNLMDGMAPAAARFKRQRLDDQFASPSPSPSPEPEPQVTKKPDGPKKEKLNVLAMAARHREEEEARARAERDDLANLPDDINFAEIRRLNIVEEMEVRVPNREARSRERDIANGRWNPKWNGMKNFKKFRKRGAAIGREPVRTIVALEEVKTKEYGIGDNYWLEDDEVERKKSLDSLRPGHDAHKSAFSIGEAASRNIATLVESSEDEDERFVEEQAIVSDSDCGGQRPGPAGTSSTKITATPSQIQSPIASSRQSRRVQEKRPAPSDATSGSRAKRQRTNLQAIELPDSEESEDELKFRFGKRR